MSIDGDKITCPSCGAENVREHRFCHDCTIYLQPLGNYRLLHPLGSGGFGTVYRGTNNLTRFPVAIKLMRDRHDKNELMRARFAREARIQTDIQHPHIVRTFEFGEVEGVGMYLVMEWLEGQTLQELLEDQDHHRLSNAQILQIFPQLLDGLTFVHSKGIVHRDLKPPNLMLVAERGIEVLKILDFGIARLDEASKQLTHSRSVMGTPHFMAPEQCRGQQSKIGPHTDLYAAGLILAWMLTGKLMFDGETVPDIFSKHIWGDIPTLSELCPEVQFSDALEQVVRKAVAKEPEARFTSAVAFLRALLEAISDGKLKIPELSTKAPSSKEEKPFQQTRNERITRAGGGTEDPHDAAFRETYSPEEAQKEEGSPQGGDVSVLPARTAARIKVDESADYSIESTDARFTPAQQTSVFGSNLTPKHLDPLEEQGTERAALPSAKEAPALDESNAEAVPPSGEQEESEPVVPRTPAAQTLVGTPRARRPRRALVLGVLFLFFSGSAVLYSMQRGPQDSGRPEGRPKEPAPKRARAAKRSTARVAKGPVVERTPSLDRQPGQVRPKSDPTVLWLKQGKQQLQSKQFFEAAATMRKILSHKSKRFHAEAHLQLGFAFVGLYNCMQRRTPARHSRCRRLAVHFKRFLKLATKEERREAPQAEKMLRHLTRVALRLRASATLVKVFLRRKDAKGRIREQVLGKAPVQFWGAWKGSFSFRLQRGKRQCTFRWRAYRRTSVKLTVPAYVPLPSGQFLPCLK